MVKAGTANGRLIINEYLHGIELIVLVKKSHFLNLYLAFWIIGWFYGEILIVGKALNYAGQSADAFLVFWLFGWSLGGIFAAIIWLWNNKGREIIRINESELRYSREFALFTRSKVYDVKSVRNLRVNRTIPSMDNMRGGMEFWGLSGGTVVFDYGTNSPKFGLGLEDAESKHVITVIQSFFEKNRKNLL